MGQLETEKQEMEVSRERLKLQPIDREMLAGLLGDFEHVFAAGTTQ